jgi:very-short-patch-repair endonuclease
MAKFRGEEDYPIYFGAGPELMKIAGDLRKSMTPAEKVLWGKLRNRQVKGYRFRRQHPLNDFIVDFFCYDAMLVVEVDGSVHGDDYQNERDIQRTRILNRLGIKEIRFKNNEVLNQTEQIIKQIENQLDNKPRNAFLSAPTPTLPLQGHSAPTPTLPLQGEGDVLINPLI